MEDVPHSGPCKAIFASSPPALCSQDDLCSKAMPSLTTSLGPFVVKAGCLFADNTLMLLTIEDD